MSLVCSPIHAWLWQSNHLSNRWIWYITLLIFSQHAEYIACHSVASVTDLFAFSVSSVATPLCFVIYLLQFSLPSLSHYAPRILYGNRRCSIQMCGVNERLPHTLKVLPCFYTLVSTVLFAWYALTLYIVGLKMPIYSIGYMILWNLILLSLFPFLSVGMDIVVSYQDLHFRINAHILTIIENFCYW